MPNFEDKDPVKVRSSYKGQLTTFRTYLSNLTSDSLTSEEISELQLRLDKIQSVYQRYDEVQLAIECSVDDSESQLKIRSEFEALYYKTVSIAQVILKRVQVQNVKGQDDSDRFSSASYHKHKRSLVKLPTIQLPKFSGSYNTWLQFRDTFVSLIHNNSDIDVINKFHYLRSCLEGSAAVVIQSVDFTAQNYSTVWKLLCDRFDNTKLLIQNHVSALFNLEAVAKESSVGLKRLLDQVNQNLRALESLGESVKAWDTLLIYIITQKLDSKSFREWEEHKSQLDNNKFISFETFQTFLRNRADLLETLELARHSGSQVSGNQSNQQSKGSNANKYSNIKTFVAIQPPTKCQKCDGDHKLKDCVEFLSLSNEERMKLLPAYKICFNCFGSGHFANHCKKNGCKTCKRKHHSLIHISDLRSKQAEGGLSSSFQHDTHSSADNSPSTHAADNSPSTNVSLTVNSSMNNERDHDVLLPTALVSVVDSNGHVHEARAILDSGSNSCLMTEKLLHKLGLPVSKISKTVTGINNVPTQINKMCHVTIKSRINDYNKDITCFVLPIITDNVPCYPVDFSTIHIPSDIRLADPGFRTPSAVDLIIGADVFWDLVESQKKDLGKGQPTLIETKLGWVVSGPIYSGNLASSHAIQCNFVKVGVNDESSNESIQKQLARFWQLEEVSHPYSNYTPEERLCEEHFVKNTTRLDDGRFCVKVPLKESPELLGESYNKAKRCFLSLERRFENQPRLAELYKEFMLEYEDLGHMTENTSVDKNKVNHYIPHHGVLRENRVTTKLRAVFNASSPTSTGVTYNDIQMVGPTVQDDLLSIMVRFRQHKYIISADIEKCYRQCSVHPDFRTLQQIIWRSDPSKPLKVYQLNTVTYGTGSAPFLATRCIKQVGLECIDEQIKDIITHDFYVDDLLTGGDSFSNVAYIRDQVTAELAAACMPLRKWKSNDPKLVPDSNSSVELNLGASEPCKTLGLTWHTRNDELHFPVSSDIRQGSSKRDVLSAIAQIFDPMGLLSPCIIVMKMLLQQMWFYKLTWDEPLPSDVGKTWQDIVAALPCLNDVHIPRLVLCDYHEWVEMHVFSDASEKAYGSCVYLRSGSKGKVMLVRLLMAKSRVAPIKPTTIPRLELCGALVSTRLYEKATASLRLQLRSVTFWTDSTVVLGWLRMMPSKLQPFVRNRVAEILEKTGQFVWRHVPTHENPADLISRGVNFASLHSLDDWWSGPSFLQDDESTWPSNVKLVKELPEMRPEVSLTARVHEADSDVGLIDFSRFSKFLKLQRTAAYVVRFVKACRKQKPRTALLSQGELQEGLNLVIRLAQRESLPERELILQGKPLPRKSPLLKFNVFLDSNKIMRVGGRLDNSNFSYQKKHPIIIQSTHRFTQLLFEFEHKALMHAGPQLLLYSIRENYWPIGGQRLAKACFRKCVRCTRMRGRTITPLMGNMPADRVSTGSLFENVGVDYAGPLNAASRQGRGCRVVKVYVCIFICLSTKAIHLELVGDLTSNSYLLALRRFMSRRGKPVNIYSDNGTSFVGAYNDLAQFLKNSCSSLSEQVANEGVNFKFIPAYSPHMGGLWEAGVKSTKYHLQRVMGHCNLTYEELYSTLVQIEAILNSRPLTPMSTDPEDLLPLTPGHFLIGRPLTSLPSDNYTDCNTQRLSRYQRIEQLRQHFWVRWQKEYVSELQQRMKWKTNCETLKPNALVIIKDDHLPPLKWKLGRIIAVHPGTDGINRVADVKTAGGVVRRSFPRICPLPDEDFGVESDASNARGHV